MMKPKFSIGQRVWLNIPESSVGTITDIWYSYARNSFEYVICYGWGEYIRCDGYELVDHKIFS